jgi:hypothetical protein
MFRNWLAPSRQRRKVYAASTITDAALVKNLLEADGIACQVVERSTARWGAGLSEVWIFDETQRESALQLISAMKARPANQDDWRCRCGETCPGTFEVCWSCGATKR